MVAVNIVSALVLVLLVLAIGSSRAGTGRMEMIKHALWIVSLRLAPAQVQQVVRDAHQLDYEAAVS